MTYWIEEIKNKNKAKQNKQTNKQTNKQKEALCPEKAPGR